MIDSGLFHVFSDQDRQRYVEGLAVVLKPGGRLFLLCFSDHEPGTQGPRRVSKQELDDAFANGWTVESIEPSRYEVISNLKDLTFSEGGPKAWFAVIRRDHKPEKIDICRLILFLLAMPVFLAVFMFLPAGTWLWERGWLFILVFLMSAVAASLYLRRANPDLLAARINRHQGTERWDKILVGFFVVIWLAILPVAALDDGRFQWFPVPWWVCLLGYALLFVGMGLLTWAEAVNKFFEPTVRIQADRGQTVIDTGPYRCVRHPGYVGGLLISIGMALSLGSLWALIPAGVSSLVLVLRTKWEDETLQSKLSGYKEFAQRVRYRLIPGVW